MELLRSITHSFHFSNNIVTLHDLVSTCFRPCSYLVCVVMTSAKSPCIVTPRALARWYNNDLWIKKGVFLLLLLLLFFFLFTKLSEGEKKRKRIWFKEWNWNNHNYNARSIWSELFSEQSGVRRILQQRSNNKLQRRESATTNRASCSANRTWRCWTPKIDHPAITRCKHHPNGD